MLEAKVSITLKGTVVDPQGQTVKHALDNLGYSEVAEVRVGKLVILKLNGESREALTKRVDEMCKKLLANPIIENYSFTISEVK